MGVAKIGFGYNRFGYNRSDLSTGPRTPSESNARATSWQQARLDGRISFDRSAKLWYVKHAI